MKISIGADHRGHDFKALIINTFPDIAVEEGARESIEWLDLGAHSTQRSDYPVFAQKVAKSILDGESEFGILICGSGVGMAIAANRFKGIYAGQCFKPEMAEVVRAHDNLNVLVLSTDFLSEEESIQVVSSMLKAWVGTGFKGGRYQERLDMTN